MICFCAIMFSFDAYCWSLVPKLYDAATNVCLCDNSDKILQNQTGEEHEKIVCIIVILT